MLIVVIFLLLLIAFAVLLLRERKILELKYNIKSLEDKIKLNEEDFNQKIQSEIEKENLKFQTKEEVFKTREENLIKERENQELLIKKFQENIETTVKQLREDSTKITSALIHDSREKTIAQSKEIIGNLINPLDKNIAEFREKFLQNEESFKNQIGQMSTYTDKLAKIFQGHIKNQGIWGEEIVEKMLELVGLKEGADYYREESFSNEMENEKERKRADFVINLKNDNHLVIDSKVSFENWKEYIETKESNKSSEEIDSNLKKFLKDIDTQIAKLAEKEYDKFSLKKTKNKSAIKYVLMFIPVEGMFSEIINNSDLFDKALSKNVIIISRASLMPALFLVKEIIDKQKQRENLEEIIKLAENVYERFRLILKNAEDAEISLSTTEKQIQESKKSLEIMKKRICGDNLIKDLKKMKALGVSSKELPQSYNITDIQELIEDEENPIKIINNNSSLNFETTKTEEVE